MVIFCERGSQCLQGDLIMETTPNHSKLADHKNNGFSNLEAIKYALQ